jgi:hypothetical protein
MYRIDQQAMHADGRRGHVSEFRTCSHSGRVLLPSEGSVSDVSGRWAATEHLVASEIPPHRRGVITETVRCAVTGKLLLQDEGATSDFSGRRGDREKLAQSPVSHKWGFVDEMVQCAESGDWFGADEVGECAVTGKLVDKRLLVQSDASGKSALKECVARCEVSGKVALPEELKACSRTGMQVLPQYLGWCCATNAWVLLKHLVHCDLPDGLITDDDALRIRCSDGRVCAKRLAKRCYWTGQAFLPDDGQVCRATKLWFSRKWIHDGQFSLLRDVAVSMDEESSAFSEEWREWLGPALAEHGSVRSYTARMSPDGHRAIVVAEFARWPWQAVQRAVMLIWPSQQKILGQMVVFNGRGRELIQQPVGEADGPPAPASERQVSDG